MDIVPEPEGTGGASARSISGRRYNLESKADVCKESRCWTTIRPRPGSWSTGSVRINYGGTGGKVDRVNTTFLDITDPDNPRGNQWRFGTLSWNNECAWVKTGVRIDGRDGSTSLCSLDDDNYSFGQFQSTPYGGKRVGEDGKTRETRGNNCLRKDGRYITAGKGVCDTGSWIELKGPGVQCASVNVLPDGRTRRECRPEDVIKRFNTKEDWDGYCVNWRYVTKDRRWTMVRDPRNIFRGGWVFINTSALPKNRATWSGKYAGTCKDRGTTNQDL